MPWYLFLRPANTSLVKTRRNRWQLDPTRRLAININKSRWKRQNLSYTNGKLHTIVETDSDIQYILLGPADEFLAWPGPGWTGRLRVKSRGDCHIKKHVRITKIPYLKGKNTPANYREVFKYLIPLSNPLTCFWLKPSWTLTTVKFLPPFISQTCRYDPLTSEDVYTIWRARFWTGDAQILVIYNRVDIVFVWLLIALKILFLKKFVCEDVILWTFFT